MPGREIRCVIEAKLETTDRSNGLSWEEHEIARGGWGVEAGYSMALGVSDVTLRHNVQIGNMANMITLSAI